MLTERAIDQLKGNSVLNYFAQQKLVPLHIAVSTRYLCIAFEQDKGIQKYHILQRYTNARLHEGVSQQVIKEFAIYDPMDLGTTDDFSNGDAHLLIVFNKAGEYSQQVFQVIKIQKDNRFKYMTTNFADTRYEKVEFGSVSIDMKYFAIGQYECIPAEQRNGDGNLDFSNVFFVQVQNEELKKISKTPKLERRNQLNLFPKCTFVGTKEMAIVVIQNLCIQLVDVPKGSILSQIDTDAYIGVELGYYLDTQSYFFIDKARSQEYIIKIDYLANQIQLEETKPFVHYDPSEPPGLSHNSVPYQYTSFKMPSIYSSQQLTSFCVEGKAFELQMQNISMSRSIVLPTFKVFYAIKNIEPYEVLVLDLNNLGVSFLTTIPTQSLKYSCETNKTISRFVLSDKNFTQSDVSQGFTTLYNFSQYLKEFMPIAQINGKQVDDFIIGEKVLVIKKKQIYYIYSTNSQQVVAKFFGLKVTFSDSFQSFVVQTCGNNYQFWTWSQDQEKYIMTIPIIKNVAARINFLPNSNTKLIIYDEFNQNLSLRNVEDNSITVIIKNVDFSHTQYFIVTEKLICFKHAKTVEGNQEQVWVLFNIQMMYPEKEFSDNILKIVESSDQNYIYVATEKSIKVLNKKNLSIVECQYAIPQIFEIYENQDITYLVSKQGKAFQILGVKTLNPQLKHNGGVTSGTILMQNLFEQLLSEREDLRASAVVVYNTLYQFGMVDGHFGEQGDTFLHYLINNCNEALSREYFALQEQSLLYLENFNGVSPLQTSSNLKKTQHLNNILEYFINNPERAIVNSEDVLTLMESPLVKSKTLLANLFIEPVFYSALPFQLQTSTEIETYQVESENIGSGQVQNIQDLIKKSSGTDQKVFQYTVSKFEYNFEQGSEPSLNFLQNYADQESEEVIRSNLRFIVMYKFQQVKNILLCQACLFFLFLAFLALSVLFKESKVITIIVLSLNTCFFCYEINQMARSGVEEYFSSIWNFTDIFGFSFLYLVSVLKFIEIKSEPAQQFFPILFVAVIICLLLRGMSYLRIFSNLRYLINMIIEIIKDMSSFVIILVYWIIGFTLVFYLLQQHQSEGQEPKFGEDGQLLPPESMFVVFFREMTLTYKLSFGDFNTDDYSLLQWILFIFTSTFIPLVLFNLIIAIMGDTYDRVQTSAKCVDLKEQANLVAEIESLMYWKRNVGESKRVLICYSEDLGDEAPEALQWEGKIKGLQKQMQRIEGKLQQMSNLKEEIVRAVSNDLREQLKKLKK